MRIACRILHDAMAADRDVVAGDALGLDLSDDLPFYVLSVRPARRIGPERSLESELVVEILQTWPASFDESRQAEFDERWRARARAKAEARRQEDAERAARP